MFVLAMSMTLVSAQSIRIVLSDEFSSGLKVRFQTKQGKFYNIQKSSDMLSWTDAPYSVMGTGGHLIRFTKIDPDKEFYRVVETETAHGPVETVPGMPVGSIIAFAGPITPEGYIKCDGRALDSAKFPVLYSIYEETWGDGGDGPGGLFNIPDFRGRAPIGAGQGPGLTSRPLAETGGEETHQLTIAEMPNHSHGANFNSGQTDGSRGENSVPAAQTYAASAARGLRSSTPNSVSPIANEPNGGDKPHNNMQPFAAVHYLIKF